MKNRIKLKKIIMKVNRQNLMSLLLINLILLISFSCEKSKNDSSTEIPTVKIGEQVWMLKNLDVSHFSNGDPILRADTDSKWKQACDLGTPAWCRDNNNTEYGKLYNWEAVNDPRGLAPEGWHIPTYDEWWELIRFLGGVDNAGRKMKDLTGWGENSNGTNESGFSGLPGGVRYYNETYSEIGTRGVWWSSTLYRQSDPYIFLLDIESDKVLVQGVNFGAAFSVRCIKNAP